MWETDFIQQFQQKETKAANFVREADLKQLLSLMHAVTHFLTSSNSKLCTIYSLGKCPGRALQWGVHIQIFTVGKNIC